MLRILILCVVKYVSVVIAVVLWVCAVKINDMNALRYASIGLILANIMIGLAMFHYLMKLEKTEAGAMKLCNKIFSLSFVVDGIVAILMGPWNVNVPRSNILYCEAISVLMLISSDSICSIAGQIHELRSRKKKRDEDK